MKLPHYFTEITENENFRLALELSPTATFVIHENGTIVYANPLSSELFGYTQDELVGNKIEILLPEHLRTLHTQHRMEFLRTPHQRSMGRKILNLWGRQKDGNRFQVDVGLTPIHEPSGVKVIVSVIDISQREKKAEALKKTTAQLRQEIVELDKLASIDSLTQVLNRRMMLKQLELELHIAKEQGNPLSIAILDIDNFKNYNDTFGHPEGDKVLAELGVILKQEVRKNDISARYGGEEFAVLIPMTNQEEALGSLERLREKIEMHTWPNRAITVSIGIATYLPTKNDLALEVIPQLIIQADKALYQSKINGKNQTTHFNEMEDEVLGHL